VPDINASNITKDANSESKLRCGWTCC